MPRNTASIGYILEVVSSEDTRRPSPVYPTPSGFGARGPYEPCFSGTKGSSGRSALGYGTWKPAKGARMGMGMDRMRRGRGWFRTERVGGVGCINTSWFMRCIIRQIESSFNPGDLRVRPHFKSRFSMSCAPRCLALKSLPVRFYRPVFRSLPLAKRRAMPGSPAFNGVIFYFPAC